MIYVSLSAIPQRIKYINRSIDSILKQTKKPDKIFINIPNKYRRFEEVVKDINDPYSIPSYPYTDNDYYD